MEIRKVYDYLNELYPFDLQEEWDNSGLQVGNLGNELTNVIVSLDLENETIEKAIKNSCNLIITHHPILFSSINKIDTNTVLGKKLEKLLKNNITVISLHTNLDIANGGVNDNLLDLLSIKARENQENMMAKIGYIKEKKAKDFAKVVKSKLNANGLIMYGNKEKIINKVAVCGGSGSDFLEYAIEKKCDLMITGDVKYHQAMDYSDRGLVILDPGHFASEDHIIYALKEKLELLLNRKVITYSKTDDFRTFI